MTTCLERALRLEPPSNPEVLGIHLAAFESANATKTTSGDQHLVGALLRIGSVADGLAAVGVDVERAREGVSRVIAGLPRRPGPFAFAYEAFRNRHAALDPLHRVRAKALASGLAEITGPFALAVLVGESADRELVDALTSAGLSLSKYRWYVAHRGAVDASCPASGPVRIVLYNDPFTPMDFVVAVLTEVFARDQDTARALMLRVHEQGSASLSAMDPQVAACGLAEARARADKHDLPLRFGAERG